MPADTPDIPLHIQVVTRTFGMLTNETDEMIDFRLEQTGAPAELIAGRNLPTKCILLCARYHGKAATDQWLRWCEDHGILT